MPSGSSSSQSSGVSKAYHPKRPHRKTRGGCTNCKTRKVKCNEGRPSCEACTKRRETCEYVKPLNPAQRIERIRHALQENVRQRLAVEERLRKQAEEALQWEQLADLARATNIIRYQPSIFPRPPTPEAQRLLQFRRSAAFYELVLQIPDREHLTPPAPQPRVLLHPGYHPRLTDLNIPKQIMDHFKRHTCHSFAVDPSDRRHSEGILSGHALYLAYESSALMNAMHAMSGLHMLSQKRHVDKAVVFGYCQIAIAQFNADMALADENTLPSLLVTSLLMTAISSETFRDPGGTKPLYIIAWMKVWRGIGVLSQRTTVRNLLLSGVSQLFYRPQLSLAKGKNHIPPVLERMVSFETELDADVRFQRTYRQTLKYLGTLYQKLKEGLSPVTRLAIVTWLTYLPNQFVDLASSQHWRALVILAHYAVFLKLTVRVWWMAGVGQQIIEGILSHLGSTCDEFLEVPRAALFIHEPRQLAILLTGNRNWSPSPVPDTSEAMYALKVRTDYVDDHGRVLIPERPSHVYDPAAPGGAAPALWNRVSEEPEDE